MCSPATEIAAPEINARPTEVGLVGVSKVVADIPNDSSPPEIAVRLPRTMFPEGHRGCEKLVTLREANRMKAMEATSSSAFWKEVKRLADPKPAPISITAASLKDVFEKRLNPPEHGVNRILAKLLPPITEDHTPEGFFTEIWNEEDMGRLKDHLRKHSQDSSAGEDGTSYTEMLEIPNGDLARLYGGPDALLFPPRKLAFFGIPAREFRSLITSICLARTACSAPPDVGPARAKIRTSARAQTFLW
ncbi:hypothetical protein B0H11DRAFT_1941090 [Mycena galericulata]|nr:hypothetical protein B0H11DRAFT_1941090 [Mycena galericulata]